MIHVDDVAAIIASSLVVPLPQERKFILSDPQPPTWNDYLKCFARELGATPVERITELNLSVERYILAPFLKTSQIIFHKMGFSTNWVPDPVTPSLLRNFKTKAIYHDIVAQELFGIKMIPLKIGLSRAASWFRENL